MPDLSLASIPGLRGDFTIAQGASNVPVQIGLRDTVLFLPGRTLTMLARHEQVGTTHVVTMTGTFSPAPALLAGQLSLESLSLTLRFRESGGSMVLDVTTAGAVVASGIVKWVGAGALGLSSAVDLQLSYRLSTAASGFVLALANVPIAVPGGLAEIESGEIGAEFPADRPVLVVAVAGRARLTSSGQANVNQLLRQLLPSAPALQPMGFLVRQEFGLVNGAVPASAQPAGVPFFRVDFDWPSGGVPTLPNLPPPLRLDLGRPTFSLPLAAGGSAGTPSPTAWTLRLPNTGIRFPTLAALSPFQLFGTLHVDSGSTNRVAFEPAGPGGFTLPDPLQFLVSSLGWGGRRAPLDEVAASATRSAGELEWQDLFRGLLPDPLPTAGLDLAALGRDLDQAIAGAIADGTLAIDRIFFTALQGLRGGGEPAYGVAWQKWFAASGGVANPFGQLPSLLLSLGGMAPDEFTAVVGALFDTVSDFAAFSGGLLKAWAGAIDHEFDQFLRLTSDLFRVVLPRLSPAKLDAFGGGLMDALVRLPELQVVATLPGLPAMPVGDAMVASSLTRVSSDRANTVSLAGLFGSLFDRTNSGTPAERRRARDVLTNIAATAADADFLLGAVWKGAVSHVMPWWDLMDRPVNRETRGDAVLPLPAGKYLIVSDVHRDRQSDVGQPFDFDSISHFQANSALYLKVIAWAKANGYTLIEGGDCEELWFVRDKAHSDRTEILRDILRDNQAVYDALRDLHRQNRYVRVYGNHDSQLRDPDMRSLLEAEMQKGGAPAFRIFDFIVIDGVKSMVERTALDKAIRMATGIAQGETPQQIVTELARGSVGMDASDYTDRCQMLVTHGHQWDFYNCDQNNAIGMFIANQVGVRVDKAMDPLIAARGLALGGNPWIDFATVLSTAPIASCWPAESEAVRLAHDVQHMANADRRLVDTVMYKESLTAITGTFGIALNASGTNQTPEQSRGAIDITRPQTILDYLKKHHNHHICVGHTHNPHSQPHLALRNLAAGLPYIGNVFSVMPDLLPVNPNLFKSKYFNSGTSGWWEGVVWAVQIDDTGQARLVFWTNRTTGDPETMDWELTSWDPAVRQQFPRTRDEFLQMLEDFLQHVVRPEDFAAILQRVLAVSIEILHAALARGEKIAMAVASSLDEVAAGVRESVDELRARAEQLRQDVLGILLTLRSRASGFRTAPPDVFTITVAVAEGVADEINRLAARVPTDGGPHAAAQALHAAVVAYPLLENYPRNLVLGALANPRFHPERQVFDSGSPVLALFSSAVSLFRPSGCLARVGNQIITSTLQFIDGDSRLQLTVTMRTDTTSATIPNS
jgi:hypothetical protein